jgi:predicted nucleotidyltransferase
MDSAQDLKEVKKIVLAALTKYPMRIFLFGSHATGRAGLASDIDVAILPEADLPAGLMSQIREELEQSNVPYQVDLVDISTTDEAFRQRVLQEGLEWNV